VDETLPSDSKPSKKVLPQLEKIGGDEEFTVSNNWLVFLTILKNMSSSMGRMTSHI